MYFPGYTPRPQPTVGENRTSSFSSHREESRRYESSSAQVLAALQKNQHFNQNLNKMSEKFAKKEGFGLWRHSVFSFNIRKLIHLHLFGTIL